MKVVAIIPARYGSTRFPGKPLVDINGISMVQRVYQQARLIPSVDKVIVSTDDERIYNEVNSFGGDCVMTRAECPTGTQRCIETYNDLSLTYDIMVNVQGDEPYLAPSAVEKMIYELHNSDSDIASLYKTERLSTKLYKDPSCVKVVTNLAGEAMYFSRNAIPRDGLIKFKKHIGVYGFKRSILDTLTTIPKGDLAEREKLEQLNWLENGIKIQMVETKVDSISVDTPEDLDRLSKFLD